MCLVRANLLENMLQVVGYQVQTHEKQQDRHSESSQNFCSFEAERMTYARSLPDFKVTQDVHSNTQHGTEGIKQNEMRESRQGQRTRSTPECVDCHHRMANAPPE